MWSEVYNPTRIWMDLRGFIRRASSDSAAFMQHAYRITAGVKRTGTNESVLLNASRRCWMADREIGVPGAGVKRAGKSACATGARIWMDLRGLIGRASSDSAAFIRLAY